ncbi:hypothetical protein ONE63_011268 [Megalurothrips usitatus]|uniref:C2H2-type domain-containing protein n=1 Tax=Megalurothrips usitatus TaxID=439358 RepID=A0AAV7WZT1_9NEOP|nr:hypothetical protein ONE63_011268 [Megalurothrips usitatus]
MQYDDKGWKKLPKLHRYDTDSDSDSDGDSDDQPSNRRGADGAGQLPDAIALQVADRIPENFMDTSHNKILRDTCALLSPPAHEPPAKKKKGVPARALQSLAVKRYLERNEGEWPFGDILDLDTRRLSMLTFLACLVAKNRSNMRDLKNELGHLTSASGLVLPDLYKEMFPNIEQFLDNCGLSEAGDGNDQLFFQAAAGPVPVQPAVNLFEGKTDAEGVLKLCKVLQTSKDANNVRDAKHALLAHAICTNFREGPAHMVYINCFRGQCWTCLNIVKGVKVSSGLPSVDPPCHPMTSAKDRERSALGKAITRGVIAFSVPLLAALLHHMANSEKTAVQELMAEADIVLVQDKGTTRQYKGHQKIRYALCEITDIKQLAETGGRRGYSERDWRNLALKRTRKVCPSCREAISPSDGVIKHLTRHSLQELACFLQSNPRIIDQHRFREPSLALGIFLNLAGFVALNDDLDEVILF